MFRISIFLLAASVLPAQAAEWEQTLASTASLRTGGAHLVSSDVLKVDDDESVLITYWESSPDSASREVYRCVDIAGPDFSPLRQTCWKVLTPAARRTSEPG